MKIFQSVQLRPFRSARLCQRCTHFNNDPAFIEQMYPGLKTLSSGFASVRDHDGFCGYHQLYLSARDSCIDFSPEVSALNAQQQGKDS